MNVHFIQHYLPPACLSGDNLHQISCPRLDLHTACLRHLTDRVRQAIFVEIFVVHKHVDPNPNAQRLRQVRLKLGQIASEDRALALVSEEVVTSDEESEYFLRSHRGEYCWATGQYVKENRT